MEYEITIVPRSEIPLYRQIAQSIEDGIRGGRLRSGARLPTVRGLAEELSVTRVTVHNAYGLLRERGLVEATVGRGTFVSGKAPASTGPQTPPGLPERRFHPPAGLPSIGSRGSLAQAEPDPDSESASEFLHLLGERSDQTKLLVRYGPAQGDRLLREQVCRLCAERGIQCGPDDVLITAGSTPALAAAAQRLARPGDRVLVESSTYFGFLSLLACSGLEPIPLEMDEEGILPEALERALLRERPRFLYTIPTFHNPSGVSMTLDRRRQVLSVAERYGLLIVEDDVFHALAYDGPAPQPLKALAPEADIVYIDSFSKCLLPGLRLGFMLPPKDLAAALSTHLQVQTLAAAHLLQSALAEYIRRGWFERHLKRVLPTYRARREALLSSLQRHMPSSVQWTRPAGGFCCWLSLPEDGRYDDMERQAAERDAGYAPGQLFDPLGRPSSRLRLCFGSAAPDRIEASIRVLGALVRERLPMGRELRTSSESVPLV